MVLLLLLHVSICGYFLSITAASTSLTTMPIIASTTSLSLGFVSNQNEHVHNKYSMQHGRIPLNGSNKRYSATILQSTTASTSSIVREEIRYIAGRRALLLHPSLPPSLTTTSSDEPNNAFPCHAKHPPLVVLGGMAQSITNWEFHLSYLAQHRSVLMYEPFGQGPPPPPENIVSTLDQYYSDVSLQRQGEDFWKVVDEAFFTPGSHYYEQHSLNCGDALQPTIDVASFSFGGRVSLAAATLQSHRIRRLHLTGVGAERDALANVHIACWKDLLSTDNDTVEDNTNHSSSNSSSRLRSFAWSIILATYSDQFLASAGSERIKAWVESVCQNNTEEGLRAILSQAHESGTTTNHHSWTPAAMAERIQTSKSIPKCRILVGSKDTIAHPSQAIRLAEMLHMSDDQVDANINNDDTYKVVDGCGHSVPMEAMRVWREDVLQFLNG